MGFENDFDPILKQEEREWAKYSLCSVVGLLLTQCDGVKFQVKSFLEIKIHKIN